MTDTHAHLTFPALVPEREAVLRRAAEAGVTRLINPGTNGEQSRQAVQLAEDCARLRGGTLRIYAAVGTHPQEVDRLTEERWAALDALARRPAVVAIGEVGLEKTALAPPLDLQRQWLKRFVDLARQTRKPLIFHVRSAHREFRRFLEAVGWEPGRGGVGDRGVVHCFSGTREDARFYAACGLRLGVTGIITYPRAERQREVVRDLDLEHFLLETDCPFLAPQSRRGQRNEPAWVREAGAAVARIKAVKVAEVERATDISAQRLFGLARAPVPSASSGDGERQPVAADGRHLLL